MSVPSCCLPGHSGWQVLNSGNSNEKKFSSESVVRRSRQADLAWNLKGEWRPTGERASSASTRARRPSNSAACAVATAGSESRTSPASCGPRRRRSRRIEEVAYGESARLGRASKDTRGRCGWGWLERGGRALKRACTGIRRRHTHPARRQGGPGDEPLARRPGRPGLDSAVWARCRTNDRHGGRLV